jgi:ABC-2 type transport system permease protein
MRQPWERAGRPPALRRLRGRADAALSDTWLYSRLIAMQVRAQAQYKVSLGIDIGTYLLVTTLEFTALFIFFGNFPTLLGWSVGQVALLYALTSLGFGLAEMIGAGIDRFDEIIRLGEFDRVLLRPAGAFIQTAGSDFRLRRLGRLMQGALAFVVALRLLPPQHWGVSQWACILVAIFSGCVIFLSVMLLGATLCFWTVETTELTNILTYGGREMLSWPFTIYNQTFQRFFLFVVPLAFGAYVPVCYLLGRPLPFGLPPAAAFAAPLVALAFAAIAGGIWRVGVSHYQSTGS